MGSSLLIAPLGLNDRGEDAAQSSAPTDAPVLQPHGHAHWDPRPVRAAHDYPLAELRFLPPLEQLSAVDALSRGDRLRGEQAQGLRAVVADAGVIDVVRNNAANRLIQRAEDGALWQFFAAMHDDQEEGPVWRDYSLQFLAMSVPFADDPAAAMGALARVASEAPEEFAGTALLHLARLGDAGVEVPPGLIETVISERLQRDDTPDALRHTCLALIGEGNRRDVLPLARKELARDDAGVEALRGALYSLGRLGDADDAQLVQSFLSHAHPGVVRAAEAAHQRLEVANAAPSPSDDQDAVGDQS
ncbi:MAG: hypothetical protein EA401_01430 [Planctomycetota bacterium]|nr:MAG: hypothetical protein EA401_01430 [Planctomycetota bacterium]